MIEVTCRIDRYWFGLKLEGDRRVLFMGFITNNIDNRPVMIHLDTVSHGWGGCSMVRYSYCDIRCICCSGISNNGKVNLCAALFDKDK